MEKEKATELGNKLANHLKVMELYQQQIDALSFESSDSFQRIARAELIKKFLDTQFEYNQTIMKDLTDIYILLMGYQQ